MAAAKKRLKMINLFKHEIKSRWIAVLCWSVGLIFFGAFYISIFPGLFEQLQSLKDLTIYKIVGMYLGSMEGYIASVILAYIPLLLSIYCITASTSTLAGEEESGTLELLVAMPLSRVQIFSAKAAALSIAVSLIMVLTSVGNSAALSIIKINSSINISPFDLFAALMSSLPLALGLIMIGLFLGALLPNRRNSAAVVTIFLITSFFIKNIAEMVQSLEPIKYFSLFNYYNTTATIFTQGPRLSDIAILLGVAAVFFILALICFNKRNITVGAWSWQRGKMRN
ncbi:MAG: ABC transporter permease subunit [Candidatus Aminicenantes bacterium]|nr:ABC transporter permease subunit [Candidatus Aminicenantes bacterium]